MRTALEVIGVIALLAGLVYVVMWFGWFFYVQGLPF